MNTMRSELVIQYQRRNWSKSAAMETFPLLNRLHRHWCCKITTFFANTQQKWWFYMAITSKIITN